MLFNMLLVISYVGVCVIIIPLALKEYNDSKSNIKKRKALNKVCLRSQEDMLEKNGGPDPCKNNRQIPLSDSVFLNKEDMFCEKEEY